MYGCQHSQAVMGAPAVLTLVMRSPTSALSRICPQRRVKLLVGSVTKVRRSIHGNSFGIINTYNRLFPPSRIPWADELGQVARGAGDTPYDRLSLLEASGGTPKSTRDSYNSGMRVDVTPPKPAFVFGTAAKEFTGQAGDVVGRGALNAGYTTGATSSAAGYMAYSSGMNGNATSLNGGCKESPMHSGSSLLAAHQSIPRTNASVQVLAVNSTPASPPSTPIPNLNVNPIGAATPSGGVGKFAQDDAFWAWMRVCQVTSG